MAVTRHYLSSEPNLVGFALCKSIVERLELPSYLS
ncbi:hypothetical protein MAQ5080_02385 [Marinomonas aquimarina]|uniref:Uncharacterized protein n=1 Tax=Marinomonas aquimarina TaxID=295068 RepID=A0A1A8TJ76_9GAMM|nr:hypothetical protein MAQ5080_02385 [Marinomonas aquimarina]